MRVIRGRQQINSNHNYITCDNVEDDEINTIATFTGVNASTNAVIGNNGDNSRNGTANNDNDDNSFIHFLSHHFSTH